MTRSTQRDGRRNETMHAIILAKLRGKITKELTERVTKVMKDQPMGVKIHSSATPRSGLFAKT